MWCAKCSVDSPSFSDFNQVVLGLAVVFFGGRGRVPAALTVPYQHNSSRQPSPTLPTDSEKLATVMRWYRMQFQAERGAGSNTGKRHTHRVASTTAATAVTAAIP